ncbi:hypothetical protein [Streptomyces sp. NPDC005476]|uniref:hypothetical protein n=1 Tax=Streptomyces sp. NPDC005476 TaxID=3156882 RepID=UPI00345432F2
MLHQFAHGGTISALTDNTAHEYKLRVIRIAGNPVESNTIDDLRRECGFGA